MGSQRVKEYSEQRKPTFSGATFTLEGIPVDLGVKISYAGYLHQLSYWLSFGGITLYEGVDRIRNLTEPSSGWSLRLPIIEHENTRIPSICM